MIMRAMVCVLSTVLAALLGSVNVMAAPGAGRLPHDDYQMLLRYQVMGPGAVVPEVAYVVLTTWPLGDKERAELERAGITLEAAVGTTAQVRGPVTAFDGLGPGGEAFPWIRALYPLLDPGISAQVGPQPIEDAAKAIGAAEVHRGGITGRGVTVGIVDPLFTGWAGRQLAAQPGRVTYLAVSHGDQTEPSIVQIELGDLPGTYELWGLAHGEQCAEAVLSVAPDANLVLMWLRTELDRPFFLEQIAAGNIRVDVLSDSTFWPYPMDHGDGRGEIAKAGDAVVESGVFYSYALGNFGAGRWTNRSFYSAQFYDTDGDGFHDFTPVADDYIDRNSLAITLHPWDTVWGPAKVWLEIILAWDGWEYQVRNPEDTGSPSPWELSEYIDVQDIDLHLWYQSGRRQVLIQSSRHDQLQYAHEVVRARDGEYSMPPVEIIRYETDQPGTYLVRVENTTLKNVFPDVYTRPVDLRIYVRSSNPAGITMEHHTVHGSFLNMGGARDVVGVGAVELSVGNEVAYYSSQGPTTDGRLKPELVAPSYYTSGVGLAGYFAGTSASAPIVAGVAALVLQANPNLDPLQMRKVLTESATAMCKVDCQPGSVSSDLCVPGAWSHSLGCGLVNAAAAVAQAIAIRGREPSPPVENNQTGNDGD